MSGLYVYCVVPAASSPPRCRGVDGSAVFAVDEAGLAAWVSEHESRPVPDARRIREHAAVVAAPFDADVTPVPFRFGQWVAGTAELRDRLRHNGDRWLARLRAFAGACEGGVYAAWHEPTAAREMQRPRRSGRAYLEDVARRQADAAAMRKRGDDVAARIREAVGDLALDERVDQCAGAAVAVAHLVRRSQWEAYREAVSRATAAMPDVALRVNGPWPPYSFVT